VLDSLNLGCIRGFLTSLYQGKGVGRKPIPPVSKLKAQLLKYLWRVPSDRRLSLLLKGTEKQLKRVASNGRHLAMVYSPTLGIA